MTPCKPFGGDGGYSTYLAWNPVESRIGSMAVASQTYQKIRSVGRLPTPCRTALKLLELANNEDSTLNEFSAVVEKDPSLASRLIQLANSPLAAQSRKIASIRQAITLLGLVSVKSVALGFSLVDRNRKGACAAFDYEAFWSESVARAAAARHVAGRVKSFPPDEAFTCGLLCQIGRLGLATVYPESYASVLEEAHVSRRPLSEAEREALDIDHNELAAEMMADWGLPKCFCNAVRLQDETDQTGRSVEPQTDPLAGLLRLGGLVSKLLVKTPAMFEFARLTQAANLAGVQPLALPDVFDGIRAEWQDLGIIFNVKTRRSAPLMELRTQAGAHHPWCL